MFSDETQVITRQQITEATIRARIAKLEETRQKIIHDFEINASAIDSSINELKLLLGEGNDPLATLVEGA